MKYRIRKIRVRSYSEFAPRIEDNFVIQRRFLGIWFNMRFDDPFRSKMAFTESINAEIYVDNLRSLE